MMHKQEAAAPQDTAVNLRAAWPRDGAPRNLQARSPLRHTHSHRILHSFSSAPQLSHTLASARRGRPLEFLGLAVVVVHDGQGLQVTGLVDVWAQAQPAHPQHLGVGVTAGQELEVHPAEADLWLLEQALAPRGQLFQLGEDKTGLPVGTQPRERNRDGLL